MDVQKVLVCDDERHIVRLIQVNLKRQGHEVITASTGAECLAKARSEKPDLVVLDITLPDIDGYEVRKQLLDDPETEHIKVIMLTNKAQDRDDKRPKGGPPHAPLGLRRRLLGG